MNDDFSKVPPELDAAVDAVLAHGRHHVRTESVKGRSAPSGGSRKRKRTRKAE